MFINFFVPQFEFPRNAGLGLGT